MFVEPVFVAFVERVVAADPAFEPGQPGGPDPESVGGCLKGDFR